MTATPTATPPTDHPSRDPSPQDRAYIRLISNILGQSEEKLLADLMAKKDEGSRSRSLSRR